MVPSALQTNKWENLPSVGNSDFWDDGQCVFFSLLDL